MPIEPLVFRKSTSTKSFCGLTIYPEIAYVLGSAEFRGWGNRIYVPTRVLLFTVSVRFHSAPKVMCFTWVPSK